MEAKVAPHGERMIEIRVRLWTDNIADGKSEIVPKHAWDAGVVLLDRNGSHGIRSGEPTPFNGFSELPRKIEKVLIDQGIKIHLSKRQQKYIVSG